MAHPLLVVAVVSGLGALGSAVWIWTRRELGAYDPDEAGYLATALRFHREAGVLDPVELIRQMGRTSHGPLVPMLSVPWLTAGPRDPRSAMLIQPVLLVVVAVSAAGIARRLAGAAAAIVTGAVVAGLPTVVLASHSYWYGLGAAACAAAAIWALVASEGLTNRNRLVFGVLVGLLPLARTMALGFVPAALLAGLVLAWGDRRRLLGLAQATVVAAVVATPWFVARREEVFDYLLSYGYGDRAGLWGSGGPLERLGFRLESVGVALGPGAIWLPLSVGIVMAVVRARVEVTSGRAAMAEGARTERLELAAVGVFCAAAVAAMVTTTNRGVWFELPLVVIVIPAAVSLMWRAPRPVRGVAAVWLLVASLVLPLGQRLSGAGHADAALAQYDQRFDRIGSRSHSDAAREWWELTLAVERDLAALTGDGTLAEVYLTGNMFVFNSNTIDLAAELAGRPQRVRVPDTLAPVDGWADQLTPELARELRSDGSPRERILVVARHDLQLFTPDLAWKRFDQAATQAGWSDQRVYPMPQGAGAVVVRRHIDNLGPS